MQRRQLRIKRGDRIDDRRQRLVIDFDQLKRVLGEVAVGCDHDRHRLTDIAHAAGGDRPAFDRRLDADHKRGRQLRHLGGGDDGGDAARAPRRVGTDRADFGVRVRRAQDRGMQRAGRNADVVDIAPAPGEKREVLDPFDGLADPAFMVRLFACFGQNATPPGAVFLTNPPRASRARRITRNGAPVKRGAVLNA